MKKKKVQGEFVLIVTILIIALLVNLVGIIMYATKAHSYTYSEKDSFEVEVDAKKLAVFAANNNQELEFVEGYGPKEVNLNYGRNNVELKIAGKNEKTYSIVADREDNREQENRLSNIILSTGKLDFEENKETYNLSVGNIDKIAVNAILKSPKSSFVDNYGPRIVDLSEGLNVVTLKVKSESREERAYKINIFKNSNMEATINDDNLLNSISIKGATIDFQKDKFDYEIEAKLDELELYAFSDNPNDSIEISDYKNIGDGGVITITVDNKNTYNITVHSQKEEVNEQHYLEYLDVGGYNLHFKKDKLDYEVVVPANRNIIVSAFTNDDANISIVQTKQNNESVVSINLTKDNKILNTYTITLKNSFWNMKNEICAVIFTFVAGLGILMIIKYFELKKKNKKVNVHKKNNNSKNSNYNNFSRSYTKSNKLKKNKKRKSVKRKKTKRKK